MIIPIILNNDLPCGSKNERNWQILLLSIARSLVACLREMLAECRTVENYFIWLISCGVGQEKPLDSLRKFVPQ